ncbi:MAG: glycosyltransferase family 4 protein [Nocardioidaceae bacterium]|nr:glycosyltransferase family 4 protein [Nocardioidaceae bacterium]
MRIGLVCPYSLEVPGGVQNHVKDLAEELRSRGHHVGVLAPGAIPKSEQSTTELADSSHGGVPVTYAGKAVPIAYNGSVARLAFGPRVAARTRRWVETGRFDVLHVHDPLTPSVSLLALRASEVPVVATFHTTSTRSWMLESAGNLFSASLDKIAARIAVSESARATLVQHIGSDPIVIPNGIYCDRFASVKAKAEWAEGGATLVFLGRIDEPRKGLDVMTAAFSALSKDWPHARLLVAGRGKPPPLDWLAPHIQQRISFLGSVADADRSRLFASAAVYVAPHIGGESFGIVLLEAMASGAPVVASDLPAFSAVLEGGRLGELFTTGDAAAAARAIGQLLGDPVRRAELSRLGRQAVWRYDWSRVTPDVEAIYRQVLTPHPSR